YVVPSGVRIADADRVRLGAHLADGTTVMHEGFCNYNAGTLGASMVEGRISAGVVIGDGTDVGGSASIMGTLSGGGTAVISLGEQAGRERLVVGDRRAHPEEEAGVAARRLEPEREQRGEEGVALGAVAVADLGDVRLVAPGSDRRTLDERRRNDAAVRAIAL